MKSRNEYRNLLNVLRSSKSLLPSLRPWQSKEKWHEKDWQTELLLP